MGERYLFHKDTMVTWRIISNDKYKNYCVGEKEKKRVLNSGHPHAQTYDSCSAERQAAFDEKEKEMLNRAYNTLDKILNYEGISSIRGYIQTPMGDGLDNADLTLHATDYDLDLVHATTNSDGYYEIYVPTRDCVYDIDVRRDDYIDGHLYNIVASKDQIGLYQENICLPDEGDPEQECLLKIFDALNRSDYGDGMASIDNCKLYIRNGVNNRDGEVLYQKNTRDGEVTIKLPAGMYTVQIEAGTYIVTYITIYVNHVVDPVYDVYMTPRLGENEIRVVLTWGATPSDLDSHLFYPGSTVDTHVCYYNKQEYYDNENLDVDDTDSYGPETTTIQELSRGQYKFYVADYTNCSAGNEKSMDMSDSGATVRVYGHDGLINTFFVPTHREGVIWEVFEIRNRVVIPIQRYYDSIGNKTWWSADK